MKKKTIIITSALTVAVVCIGLVSGHFIYKALNNESIQTSSSSTTSSSSQTSSSSSSQTSSGTTSQNNSQINFNFENNNDYGNIIYENKDYQIGDMFSFKVEEKTNENKLTYIEFENQKYVTNSDNYFTFQISDTQIDIVTRYQLENDNSKLVDISFTNNYGVELSSSNISSQGKVNVNSFVKIDCSLDSNLAIESLFLNEEYNITKNLNNEYEFKAFVAKNDVTTITKVLANENADQTYMKFLNYVNNRQIENIDFSSEEVLNNFTPIEIARISLYLLNKESNFYTLSFNKAVSSVLFITNTQKTNSIHIKNLNKIFKENIAVGDQLKMAERFVYDDSLTKHYQVSGDSVVDNQSANYNSQSFKEYNQEQYINNFGISIYDTFHYKLNDEYSLADKVTIDDMSFENSIVKENNNYVITLNLSPQSADDYGKYMMTTTNFEGAPSIAYQTSAPTFKSIGVKIVVDSSLMMKEYISRENYDINTQFFAVNTLSYSKCQIYYNELSFPTLSDKVDYSSIFDNITL